MPELPEVETVVRGLRPAIVGRRIVSLRVGHSDFIDDPTALEAELPGRRIAGIERQGKYIVIQLEPVEQTEIGAEKATAPPRERICFIVHLGMTGRLFACEPSGPVAPHTHVYLELDDGRQLRYVDIRRFGRMTTVPETEIGRFLARIGADPLQISCEEFVARLRARRARIKALLLAQTVLSGLGNIYADESLWRARIHPARMAAQLRPAQLRGLWAAMRAVLGAAIRLGGSSISDFLDTEGKPGSYQRRHRVYGRKGKPCPRCGAKICRMRLAGRGTYFCPRCQRAPTQPRRQRNNSKQ